jgi:hypothetical protein
MDTYSNSATRQLLNQGNRLGRWMRTCVASLAEDLAGTATDSASNRTMIVMTGEGAEIHARGKTGPRELVARLEGHPDETAGALKRALHSNSSEDVLLRITSDRAVVKDIQLPSGALEVLPAVIRNKIESLAPWPLSEALWGYKIAGPPKSGQITVSVGIVSRKSLDGLLALLGEAGVKVGFLDIARSPEDPDAIAIDFQNENRLVRARRKLKTVMSIAAVLCLATASYGLYLALMSYSELSSTEARTAELKQALVAGSGSGNTGAKLSEANKLYQRKLESRPVVVILNDLTKLVPDGTWLNTIDYENGQVTISGRGTEIPNVIESLEKSDVFSKVNFASATQRDPNLDVDIFSISASIDKQGAKQ